MTTPRKGTASIFQGENGEWYLRLRGMNGEILATTEGHKNRIDVLDVWNRYFYSFRHEQREEGGES